MKGKTKALVYGLGTLILLIVGVMFVRFELPVVSVAAEHIPGWYLGPIPITNALLTSWVVTAIIIVMVFVGTRKMELIPSGLQNILEFAVETLFDLTEGISGPKWSMKFFIIPATIFFYVLVSNWFGLIPGLAGVGICAEHHTDETHAAGMVVLAEGGEEASHAKTGWNTCAPGEVIIPFFRSPSADLNNTLMLALFTQIAAQVFGFMALGFGGYMGKFFVFGGVAAAFKPDAQGNKRSFGGMLGQLAMGLIDVFVGFLEFLSEFIKVLAYTFRLFGNIFAGEVMLIVLTFLIPFVLTVPFLGLEVFVGLVQAFVFFILSVAFYSAAVTSHSHEEAH